MYSTIECTMKQFKYTMSEKKEVWILKGYEKFALYGEASLKIEQLAKEVGISKSSFYHLFADMEIFVAELFKYHLNNSKIIADKERLASTIKPELINILLQHKIDLLFNRQLRINSTLQNYKDTLLKSNQYIGNDFVMLWLKDTKLNFTTQQAATLLELALENFFLQINQENLNYEWLVLFFENLERVGKTLAKPLYGND